MELKCRLPAALVAALVLADASPAATRLDADAGRLTLTQLRVQDDGERCYDVALSIVSTAPVRLQLTQADPVACASDRLSPSHFDARDGLLRLPGLAVQRGAATECHDAALRVVNALPVTLELAAATPAPCAEEAARVVAPGRFDGSVVLGAPTASGVGASVLSAGLGGRAWLAYGLAPGIYNQRSASITVAAGEPAALRLDGLLPDLRYHYRLMFEPDGGTPGAGPEASFHTARPAGRAFTFTLQSDSHLDENADLPTYQRTLANVLADAPDFHVDLGDTFMTEKRALPLSATSPPAASAAEVNRRYAYEHAQFGRMAHSVPLFLVNGNHEGELGWLRTPDGNNLAVWAGQARQRYFAVPASGGFFRGDTLAEPFVGERAAWTSWHWGDALFVMLDPFWNSARVGNDAWNLTLGERQYRWLAQTLAASPARWKFVFLHNLVGGLDGAMRGGIEGVPFYEWGGRNADGSDGFAARRPGWGQPIHALLVQHRVTAVFKGHDHLYARQQLDGVVYQTVPQPSARNFSSGLNLARDYRYVLGQFFSSSGHLRVQVSPQAVQVQYVRSWLPQQETAQRRNGQVEDSWTVTVPAAAASAAVGAPR